MPLTTIITGTQQRSKDSFSSSPAVGLALRTNGEETPKVIDALGNVFPAGIAAPTVVPTVVDAGPGLLPNNKWAAYIYVYASSRFPFVESDLAVNGSLFPRSNASPPKAHQYYSPTPGLGGSRKVSGTATKTTAAGINIIWIFRTAFFDTDIEALTAAEAGQAFFSSEVSNDGIAGLQNWTDNNPVSSADQVQSDNYVAPQMQFAVYYDPYWWGFGNMPFSATATWTTAGLITITAPDKWFDGRNGQNVSLSGITTGGYDGNGTFYFIWISGTTARASTTYPTITIPTIAASGAPPQTVTVQGPATTLFRSKSRNPFSWGLTEIIGSANVPRQYAFKIGGGLGSALAVVPNNALLKLDCEYPAKCYTLNLRSAGTSTFESTLRIISDVYSVTAHFSQFPAVTANGNTVLWGLDFKNFAILQSDGNSQVPISLPIPRILRGLTLDRTQQLLSHGVYDPRTELNCIWVAPRYGLALVSYLIYQHAPTGFWGFSQEYDILSSGAIQDTLTGAVKTFVGTETGILGQAFVEDVYNNFLPDTGTYCGTITAATPTTISVSGINNVDNGIIGNWAVVTDENGQQEQICRISARTPTLLTFDRIRAFVGGGTIAFNPVPQAGDRFYIGLIECRMLKYFDLGAPQADKNLIELWLTQQGVDVSNSAVGTLIRYYRERSTAYQQFAALQDVYEDTTGSDVWFVDDAIPSELVKMFGLEIINRGYERWRFVNMTLLPRTNP